ncbi:hypothetical protein C4D60_Mb10t24600 [Musa balbisiana]|uniref:Peroxisomal nicotinamide adenine dinucleotide carrier n=1 Tax=Musa balbisiana TaxID=52838 RepID=A0A4S8J208_MUSBA|nr:hypothetical protein C4D60_Mb10t24600 [Musa balbisiana]
MSDALINGVAGAGGGIIAQLITYPLLTVNTRQQTERDPSRSAVGDGAVRQMLEVVKQEGWGRLYGGLAPSLVGTAASQGVYYYFYQIFRDRAERSAQDRWRKGIGDGSVGMFQSLVVAALAGSKGMKFLCFHTHKKTSNGPPIHALSCLREEAVNLAVVEHQPCRTSHVVQELYNEAGLWGFWKGVVPTLIMVSNPSIQFMLYETLLKKIKRRRSLNTKGAEGFTAHELLPNLELPSLRIPCTYDAITKMIRYEGLSGLYKGMGTKIVQSVFAAAVLFTVKEELVKAARVLVTGELRRINNSRMKTPS